MGLFGSLSWALAQRALWISRANNAWGSSRVWNSGSSFETDAANNLAQYNSEVTAFNNLQNGLNNPDGLSSAAISTDFTGGTGGGADHDFATFTLTLPRSGHYVLGFYATGVHHNVGFGVAIRCVTTGSATGWGGQTLQNSSFSNSGDASLAFGYYTHADCSAGQTVSVDVRGDFVATGSLAGTIYAHFVPDASHHN